MNPGFKKGNNKITFPKAGQRETTPTHFGDPNSTHFKST